MDPITLSLIGAGLNIGGGILGQLLSGADTEEALNYRKKALAEYMGISLPELEELVAKEQGDTNLAGVTTDPSFDAQQDLAAGRLEEIASSGGFDARSRARMEQARMESAQAERSSREGVLASARARSTLGTGEELSALLQAGQSAADRERMAGVQTAADAEDRALEAIITGGSMAAERQGRQWGQKAQVASAQDEIDRFNTATANNFTLANADQRQQHFQNQMQLAGARSGAQERMAGHYEDKASRTREMWGGIGQSLGYAAGAAGQWMGQGGGAPSASAVRQATPYEARNPGAVGSSAALPSKYRRAR